MNLRSLDIPEFGPERDSWLDDQLASGQLPEVVAELLALQGLSRSRPDSLPAIDEWLGSRRDAFLAGGVATLDESQRRDLTRFPWLLLDLQSEIDAEGGDHWVDVAMRSADFAAVVERNREEADRTPRSGRVSRRSLGWIGSLAVIAATMAVAWIGWRVVLIPAPAPVGGWGWNQQDLFAGSPTAAEYLNRLADAGAKWRNKRPETKGEVGQRIREMRAGCQRLIDGKHPPLSDEQSASLQALCRKWAGQFDEVLANLDADRLEPIEARAAIDEIVDKLVARLRSGKLT
jgi:hypothetical protein